MRMNERLLELMITSPEQVELDVINGDTYVVTINDKLINRQVAVYKSFNKLNNDVNDYFTIRNHLIYLHENNPNEIFKYNGKYYFTV